MTAAQAELDRTATSIDALPAFGLWAPALTPVRADFSIDTERYLAHARWLLEHGCHGLAPFGTTSEANSFSVDERIALLEAMVGAGIDPARLMVGTGCCAVTDSVRLTAHAASLGCKKVLMLPPFYYKGPSDEGLLRGFATVIERVGDPALRVFLYHFPRMSTVPITAELLGMLVERFPGTIAGVKDSSGDWANTEALIERFPGLAIFPGSETFLLDGLKAGGAGSITATANVGAPGVRAVIDAWQRDDGTAGRAQAQATRIRRIVERAPLIPAQKFLLAHYRGDPAWRETRPPLLPLDEEAGRTLVAELEPAGFDGGSLAV